MKSQDVSIYFPDIISHADHLFNQPLILITTNIGICCLQAGSQGMI